MIPSFLLATLLLAAAPADAPLLGFSAESAAAQRALEARFDARLSASDYGPWMDRLAAHPHHLGSPWGQKNAEFLAEQFRSWGYDTRVEEFQVLFPTPKVRLLEMVAPTRFRAALAEPALPQDRTSSQQAEQLPDVQRLLGGRRRHRRPRLRQLRRARDYEELDRRGIDVKGKVVLARYGGSWRGIKPKVAAETRRRRLHHLLGPARGRLLPGRGVPEGRLAQRPGRAARLGGGHAPLSGRPAHARSGRHRRTRSGWPSRTRRRSRRSPCCPSPTPTRCRCCARWAGPWHRRPGGAACPCPTGSGPGPARVHLKVEFDWSLRAAAQRGRDPARLRPARPVDRARQPSRRLGQRRRRTRSAAWWR